MEHDIPRFAGATLTTGVWYFAAFTFDGTIQRLYLNGVEENNTVGAITWENLDAFPPAIGAAANAVNFFNGMIDEVDVYNRALSPAEVEALYNARGSGKCHV